MSYVNEGDVVEIVLDVTHVSDDRGEFERVIVQGVFPRNAEKPALAAGDRRNVVDVFFGRRVRVPAFLIATAIEQEGARARIFPVTEPPPIDSHRPPSDAGRRDTYDTGWSDAMAWGWQKLALDAGWTPPPGQDTVLDYPLYFRDEEGPFCYKQGCTHPACTGGWGGDAMHSERRLTVREFMEDIRKHAEYADGLPAPPEGSAP